VIRVIVMKIGEIIRSKDIDTYRKLKSIEKKKNKKHRKKKEIELGDSIHNLMKHDAHKRIGRRIRQIRWG
jgi:hypothetical protein